MRSLFFPWGVLLQLVALVHFMRRRPDNYWLWIIIFFGPIGALAYIVVEMAPDMGFLGGNSMRGFSRGRHIRTLENTVLENPSAGNYEQLGDLLLESKKYARARECFDKALEQRTDSIDPFYRRGIAAFELGDAAAALPDFERVVKADRTYDYGRARLYRARALAAAGRDAEAGAAFDDVSNTTEAMCYAAEFFAAHGRGKHAKELVDQIALRKRTMPSYQKRRERPFLRRSASLRRKLQAA
jgi:hypothetical protein